MGHNYIGTEHLLLGLFREPDGLAAQILADAGATHAAQGEGREDPAGPHAEVAARPEGVVLAHQRAARVAAVDVAEERREDVVPEQLLEPRASVRITSSADGR